MKKEFHWFQNDYDLREFLTTIPPYKFLVCVCKDMYNTGKALKLKEYDYILSTQAHYFSQDTLDKKYKLFAHFANGDVVEVKRGKNECTTRNISYLCNLEKLLLAGEFGGEFND